MESYATIGQAKREIKENLGGQPRGWGFEVAYDRDLAGAEVIDIYLHGLGSDGESLEEGVTLRSYPIAEESKALAYAKKLSGNYKQVGE